MLVHVNDHGIAVASERLHHDRGSITKNLSGAHHWTGVVADADDRIGAQSARVQNHQLERFLARGFTEIRKYADASAKKSSQASQDAQWQRPCPDGDPTDNSDGLRDAKSGELENRRGVHVASLLDRRLALGPAVPCPFGLKGVPRVKCHRSLNFFRWRCPDRPGFGVLIFVHTKINQETAMLSNKKLTTILLPCALAAALIAGAAAAAEPNYCIAVGGGFGAGGTSFIGKGFAIPAAGNCVPWSGFTKTATTVILTSTGTGCLSSNGKVLTVSISSADPAFFGAGTFVGDYITVCPSGASGCPAGSNEDQGEFSGSAEPQTCTTKLLTLPPTHD